MSQKKEKYKVRRRKYDGICEMIRDDLTQTPILKDI